MTVVDDFAADYFVAAGITPQRQRDVLLALAELERSAGTAPEQLDHVALRGFQTALLANGLHVNTVRKKLLAIKPFYKWCWQHDIIDDGRWLRIQDVEPPRGSTARSTPKPYKRHEIQRFWTELDATYPLARENLLTRWQKGTTRYHRIWTHAAHLQTQAVVSLALFAGMRRNEIRFAELDDIHPDNDYIVVWGKSPFGERQGYREVPYTEAGRAMVGEWLKFRELLKPGHDSPWVIVHRSATLNRKIAPTTVGAPMGRDPFEGILAPIGGWELHRFRHTCATEWLRAGAKLEKVSRLLGHANLQQTMAYTELVRDDIRDEVRRNEADFVTAVGRRLDHPTKRAA